MASLGKSLDFARKSAHGRASRAAVRAIGPISQTIDFSLVGAQPNSGRPQRETAS
jgi:hypothetical protein